MEHGAGPACGRVPGRYRRFPGQARSTRSRFASVSASWSGTAAMARRHALICATWKGCGYGKPNSQTRPWLRPDSVPSSPRIAARSSTSSIGGIGALSWKSRTISSLWALSPASVAAPSAASAQLQLAFVQTDLDTGPFDPFEKQPRAHISTSTISSPSSAGATPLLFQSPNLKTQ